MSLKVAFVSRDPAVRMAGAKALEGAPEHWAVELVHDLPPNADVVVCGPDVPECPGLRFDPADPSAVVDLIAAAVRRPSVIAVASACGGSGVTTIALHLARSYASCVVECGARAGIAERLGLDRSALRTWDPDEPSSESIALSALPFAGGFRAIVAPGDEPAGLERVIDAARAMFETVVIDVACDYHPSVVACDVFVAVMPPTVPGALRTRALLQDLRPGVVRAVVANRLGPGGESTRAELQHVLGDVITLELPVCATLRDAEDDGALLPARHRWARRVEKLADGLRARTLAREGSAA